MKKFLFSVLFLTSLSLLAQQPISYDGNLNLQKLTTYSVAAFDMDKIDQEDNQVMQEKGIENIGRVSYESLNKDNNGTWTTLADGSKLWRLEYTSKGAEGTCVYFDFYNIPEGGEVYLSSADKSYSIGPFGSEENNDHGKFVTDVVPGETAVLEYYQPADVVGEARIDIMGFGHFYKGVYESNEDDFSKVADPCEVDVNCPEGDGWEDQRDAVVRLRMTDGQFIFYCSGSMVNNTAQDCKKYILTALHCVEDFTDDNLLLLKVRFNYSTAGCAEGAQTTSHNRTGVFLRADSNGGGGQSGSDFALLEVEDEVPESWNTYYAGWDVSGLGATSGVGIHHPAGDRKKISTFISPLITTTWASAFGAHWRVVWAETETEHGVTEGGSSGSPIFNPDKRIVGTLTGGGSFCETPFSPDSYGKMSYHWESNPNSATQKLKVWLDPGNTGLTTLDGLDCDPVDIEEVLFNDISIYPNPTNNNVSIEFIDTKINNLKVFNSLGVLVKDINVGGNQLTLDMKDYPTGIYYLTFTSDKGYQLTKKVTKL